MPTPSYLRHPHLHGDLVTFVAEDDVWVAPVAGGRAWRLSDDHAPAAGPRFSPDGATVAWTSTREGAPEVFCAPAAGGVARRLTWWGATRTAVLGWRPDGDLLVTSTYGQAATNRAVARPLSLTTGPGEVLPWGLVAAAALEPGGPGVLVSTPTLSEPAWRKRYRGGTASVLWLDPAGAGDFARLLADLTSGLVNPVWTAGGRLAFVSDHDGSGQLWSLPVPAAGVTPTRADLVRHTDSDSYVRHASSDGTRVVWCSGGELWRLDDLDPTSAGSVAVPVRLDVSLGGPRTSRAPRLLPAKGAVSAVAPDHTARASVLEVRSTIQWLPHRDGPARLLTPPETEPSRGRLPVVLGRTGRVAWVGDAGGEDGIVVTAESSDGAATPGSAGTVTYATGEVGTVLELVASPDGAVLAAAVHDGRVLAVDVATGAVHEVARSVDGEVTGLVFAPDSAWLAWSHPGPEPLSHIRLTALDGATPVGDVVDVTPMRFSDTHPAFSADGAHLAFLSMRSFDPLYDTVSFDMAFVGGWRPHLVPLGASTPSPFDPSGPGRTADGSLPGEPPAADEAAGSESTATATATPVPPRTVVDPGGLADRIRPFPVAAGVLTGLRAVAGGFAWLRAQPAGVLGDDRPTLGDDEARPVLERFDLASRTARTLVPAVDSFTVSGDGTRLVVRDHDDLVVVPATRPAPTPEDAEPGSSDRVVVDLERVQVRLDPAVEWRQEFGEAWRRMRDNFWRADLDGVDWAAARARYEPLLDAIATADDLVDLLWETQGELATGHAYVRPQPHPDPARKQGLLAADLRRDADGTWRVARVLPGESSDPRARSPLAAPAVGVGPGDALLAVAGRAVAAGDGPNALLVGTVDRPVELTIAPADGSAPRTVVVVPIADEVPIRYHDWVSGRRAATRELSGGRLGYVHVPDMVGSGWAELHRDLRLETAFEGLVVDVRENKGGHTSELVIEKLARRVVGWARTRGMEDSRYPHDAPRGAVVLIANQWSGSDGDIVNVVAQAMGIGPVIGERTWGGVIGIDSKYVLVDGTTVNQPRYAHWFEGPGWGVENHGVDPDVEVVHTPADLAAGRDPQLEAAVRIALETLAVTPAAAPPATPPATGPSPDGPRG